MIWGRYASFKTYTYNHNMTEFKKYLVISILREATFTLDIPPTVQIKPPKTPTSARVNPVSICYAIFVFPKIAWPIKGYAVHHLPAKDVVQVDKGSFPIQVPSLFHFNLLVLFHFFSSFAWCLWFEMTGSLLQTTLLRLTLLLGVQALLDSSQLIMCFPQFS